MDDKNVGNRDILDIIKEFEETVKNTSIEILKELNNENYTYGELLKKLSLIKNDYFWMGYDGGKAVIFLIEHIKNMIQEDMLGKKVDFEILNLERKEVTHNK